MSPTAVPWRDHSRGFAGVWHSAAATKLVKLFENIANKVPSVLVFVSGKGNYSNLLYFKI